MLKKIEFVKMQGTGNDFIMLDNRKQIFPSQNVELIKGLCNRRLGIGADGIILIENSKKNDFKMRILNADGSEAEMCGNGARCAVKYASMLKIINNSCSVETVARELKATLNLNSVKINMGSPMDLKSPINLNYENQEFEVYFINTGVPHAVMFVEDINTTDVFNIGKFLRYHEAFKPKGTNCNFVQITGQSSIKVRTYERGVEDETYSCGTGTCASAIISVLYKELKWPIISTTIKNDSLIVDSTISKNNEIQEFFLNGPVTVTFNGEVEI